MYKYALAALFTLSLAGCATSSVNVVHVAPAQVSVVPNALSVDVQGEHEPTVYAARQALRSTQYASGQLTSGQTPVSSTWRLRADATVAIETQQDMDLFCRRPGMYYGPWGPYSYYGYGRYGYDMYCPRQERVRSYPVRTITWTLEDSSGHLVWQAKARELRPGGPPVEPSMRLAASLDQWLAQLRANQATR